MSSFYYSLNDYCRSTFGHKLYKLSLDGGMTCPNRDGTLGTRGCIFCSAGGSGDFSARTALPDPYHALSSEELCRVPALIRQQMDDAANRIQPKMPADGSGGYIAYFQAFTNTYAPTSYLRTIYHAALSCPGVEVLSIATRPDCLSDETLALLAEIRSERKVWVELGLQTIHASTAAYIRRGYDLACFERAVKELRARDIDVIVHVILGLPGESDSDMLATIDYLAGQDIQGIKLQLLHILQGTDLAADYEAGHCPVMEMDHYLTLVCECLRHLPPSLVVHRLTGDGPKKLLIAPTWSGNKKLVWNALQRRMQEENVIQGSHLARS